MAKKIADLQMLIYFSKIIICIMLWYMHWWDSVKMPLLESLGAIPVIWTSSSPIFCISRSWSQAKHAFLMTTAYLGLLICDVWGCISSIINRLCHKTIPNNKYMWLSEIQIIRLKKKTQNVHRPYCSPEQHSNITNDFCTDTNF